MYRLDANTQMTAVVIDVGLMALIFPLTYLLSRYWMHIAWCLARKTTEHGKIRYVHASGFPLYRTRTEGEMSGHIHSAGVTLDDGRRVKVYMNHADYMMLRAGSEGLLTHEGGRFIRFVPDDSDIPAAGE